MQTATITLPTTRATRSAAASHTALSAEARAKIMATSVPRQVTHYCIQAPDARAAWSAITRAEPTPTSSSTTAQPGTTMASVHYKNSSEYPLTGKCKNSTIL